MLIVLPLLTFALLFVCLNAAQEPGQPEPPDWRKAFLQAALLWGGLVALSSEALGFFNLLGLPGVAGFWLVFAVMIAGVGWKTGVLKQGWNGLLRRKNNLDRLEKWVGGCLVFLVSVLFLISVIAPSNNTDSMQYHMSRVAHWAQNQSLRHYPTGFEPQLLNPIWAEEAILHIRILWGSDQPANLVQWFAMLGSLIGVSALAKLLGANSRGQIAAAVFAACLPIGILEATSTQNDYVAAFWLVCLAYFVILGARRRLSQLEWISLALALSLGMLTKGTFYPYAVPFGIWFIAVRVVREKPRFIAVQSLILAVTAVLLNAGYWLRNIQTYGGPLGPAAWVQNQTAKSFGLAPLAATLSKNILLNFATPSEWLNAKLVAWLDTVLTWMGQGTGTMRLIWAWNYEDLAGNPLGVGLVLLTLILVYIFRKKILNPIRTGYLLAVLAAFLMLCLVVTFDQYGVRYQLPFWVAFAAVFGFTLSEINPPRLAPALMFFLLLTALPYTLINRSRPILALRQNPERFGIRCLPGLGCTSVGSILHEPPSAVMFANWTEIRDPYQAITRAVQASGCKNVGLQIDSHEWEYPYWWLLQAPQSGIRIETLYYAPALNQYEDPAFKPCAVICTLCGGKPEYRGLPLAGDFGFGLLYAGENYQPAAP